MEVIAPSHLDNKTFWRDWPDPDELPASVHRAAALAAVRMLTDEVNVPARQRWRCGEDHTMRPVYR